jgi:hypothetical protein
LGEALDTFTFVLSVIGVCAIGFAWWFGNGCPRPENRIVAMARKVTAEVEAEIDAETAAWQHAARAAEQARFKALTVGFALQHRAIKAATHYRTYGDLWLDVAVGDEVQVFKCAGCDRVRWRGEDGYVKVCDGVEFCSAECQQDPLPFAALPESRADHRSLN